MKSWKYGTVAEYVIRKYHVQIRWDLRKKRMALNKIAGDVVVSQELRRM